MEIKKHNKNKKIIISIIIVCLISAAIVCGWLVLQRSGNTNNESSKENKEKVDDNSKKATNTNKDSDSTEIKITNVSDDNKTPIQYEGESVQNNSSLTGSLQIIGPVGDNFMIRINIDQLVQDANGRCELTLNGPNGQVYTETVNLIDNPQTSTCYGWDIPLSKLANTNGKWTATVKVSGDGKTGTLYGEKSL